MKWDAQTKWQFIFGCLPILASTSATMGIVQLFRTQNIHTSDKIFLSGMVMFFLLVILGFTITQVRLVQAARRRAKEPPSDEESVSAAIQWYRQNEWDIDGRQRTLLAEYLDDSMHNNHWLRRVDMIPDDRGTLIKCYYNQGLWTPTFVIVRDATIPSRIHSMMVHPDVQSATEGLAWLIDLPVEEYKRVQVES